MPSKGMRSICLSPETPSFSFHPDSPNPSLSSHHHPTTPAPSSSPSIEAAALIIRKWNPDTSSYARVTSLFYESRTEARQFIQSVNNLQRSMHGLMADQRSAAANSQKLALAQSLMEIAMKRLQREFYQILSMNRAQLDPESVSTRSSRASTQSNSSADFDDDDESTEQLAADSSSDVEEVASAAMDDLKSIADCMIGSGYAKECVSIYKVIRKSIIDEGIYRLGVERISTSSHGSKMKWKLLESKIKNWMEAVKISIKTLFTGERILCDHVFSCSNSIRESCFAEISKEGASLLFGFPDYVTKTKKKPPPENIFRVLDMYSVLSENWADIEWIFSSDHQSTSAVRAQVLNSLVRLSESARSLLADFEAGIKKDPSKSVSPAGGVDSLTVHGMIFLSLISDYVNIISDVFSDYRSPEKPSSTESCFDDPGLDDSTATPASLRFASFIMVLLCKIDEKSKRYQNEAVSYLYMATNLQHVISKVQSSNLRYLLGKEWVLKHKAKLRQFTESYEKLAWGPVVASLPQNPSESSLSPAAIKQIFRRFRSSFEEAYVQQSGYVVPDGRLRGEIKNSIARKILPAYRVFYDAHRSSAPGCEENSDYAVSFGPETVENRISELFRARSMSRHQSFGSSSPASTPRRHDMRSPRLGRD